MLIMLKTNSGIPQNTSIQGLRSDFMRAEVTLLLPHVQQDWVGVHVPGEQPSATKAEAPCRRPPSKLQSCPHCIELWTWDRLLVYSSDAFLYHLHCFC